MLCDSSKKQNYYNIIICSESKFLFPEHEHTLSHSISSQQIGFIFLCVWYIGVKANGERENNRERTDGIGRKATAANHDEPRLSHSAATDVTMANTKAYIKLKRSKILRWELEQRGPASRGEDLLCHLSLASFLLV